jgi:hypothetical protein
MVTKNLLKAAVKIGKPIVKGVGEFFGEAMLWVIKLGRCLML